MAPAILVFFKPFLSVNFRRKKQIDNIERKKALMQNFGKLYKESLLKEESSHVCQAVQSFLIKAFNAKKKIKSNLFRQRFELKQLVSNDHS